MPGEDPPGMVTGKSPAGSPFAARLSAPFFPASRNGKILPSFRLRMSHTSPALVSLGAVDPAHLVDCINGVWMFVRRWGMGVRRLTSAFSTAGNNHLARHLTFTGVCKSQRCSSAGDIRDVWTPGLQVVRHVRR